MTNPPYDFILDYLPAGITLKKMFGMNYIYIGKKIMLILRKRDNEADLNGIWVATSKKYHESLKKEIPELGAFSITGDERLGNWLLIPDNSDDFEAAGIKICELITHHDPRVGHVPK